MARTLLHVCEMMRSNIFFVLTLMLLAAPALGGGLSWGTMLGADWAEAEGERNSDQIIVPIK